MYMYIAFTHPLTSHYRFMVRKKFSLMKSVISLPRPTTLFKCVSQILAPVISVKLTSELWLPQVRVHLHVSIILLYMRISTNHNSLGCEQPSRRRCRTITQCTGRVSANARPLQLRWGDRNVGVLRHARKTQMAGLIELSMLGSHMYTVHENINGPQLPRLRTAFKA